MVVLKNGGTSFPVICTLKKGIPDFRGLKRWDEGRWVVYTLLYGGLFPIPHLPSSQLLSPVMILGNSLNRLGFKVRSLWA